MANHYNDPYFQSPPQYDFTLQNFSPYWTNDGSGNVKYAAPPFSDELGDYVCVIEEKNGSVKLEFVEKVIKQYPLYGDYLLDEYKCGSEDAYDESRFIGAMSAIRAWIQASQSKPIQSFFFFLNDKSNQILRASNKANPNELTNLTNPSQQIHKSKQIFNLSF